MDRRWRRIRLRIWRWSLVPVVLVIACLLGSGMCLSHRTDRDWNQDEAISFLESTCHLSDYKSLVGGGAPPYGAWAAAHDWQRLIESEGELCLGQIRSDLATGDMHPPLYFWLLHLWLLGNGGQRAFMATIGLNLLLAAVGTLALYKLGRTLFASRLDGAALAFCAALNTVAAYASMEFRPYALLGAVTSIYLLALERARPAAATRRSMYLRGAALSLATAAGVLTHHMFGAVLIGGAVYAAARLLRKPRELLRVGAFSAAGVALALVLFPLVTQIASKPLAVAPADAQPGLREARIVSAFSNLLPRFDDRQLLLAGAVGLIVCLLGVAWNDWPRGGFRRTRGLAIVLVVLVVPGVIVLQYALGFSPSHAMKAKYLASLSPLVGLCAALVFRLIGGRQRFAIAAACCVLLGTVTFARIDKNWERLFANARIMKESRLIIDDVTRARLPMTLARIKPDTQVFVATQDHILGSEAWRTADDFTFVTCLRDWSARKRSKQLAVLFSQTHDKGKSRVWGTCWYAQPFKARGR